MLLHGDYVNTTMYIYEKMKDKSYKLVSDTVEHIDNVLLTDSIKMKELYKFKYSNPDTAEIMNYAKNLSLGVYMARALVYYLDKI